MRTDSTLQTSVEHHKMFALFPKKWWLFIVTILLIASIPIGIAHKNQNSDWVVQMVDEVRAVVGPRPVAIIEETVFHIQDLGQQLYFKITGKSLSSWQLTTIAPHNNLASNPQSGSPYIRFLTSSLHTTTAHTVTYQSPIPPLFPLLHHSTLPGEGIWQPLASVGQPSAEAPILWQTVFRPDATHPFAQVAIVAMDLHRSQLHMMIGTQEPKSKLTNKFRRPGMLPPAVQSSGTLLAAWNGGFKAIHGHYGMMSDGHVWLPPKPGMATLAIEKDGRVLIGAWGNGSIPNADMIAWRQNNPPLIENGHVNPDVHSVANDRKWGVTITKMAYTWRSGLGLSKDGRWLFYVTGNSLTTKTLTRVFEKLGVYNAMQTDINHPFDRFETYSTQHLYIKYFGQTIHTPISARKLIDKMSGNSTQFLVPYKRDFFYLTSNSSIAQQMPVDPSLDKLWASAQVPRTPTINTSIHKFNRLMDMVNKKSLIIGQ